MNPDFMIPYFQFLSFSLGPLTIHFWGLLVAMGFLTSLIIFWPRARQKNLPAEKILNLGLGIILCSLFFARLFYVLFGGNLNIFLTKPWLFLAFWQGGMSSMGGFFGAGLAMLSFRAKRGIFGNDKLKYADILAYSFPFGWLIGRFGCFLIHDHPGRLTNSFLGVNFSNGTRFDMALMEILALLPLTIIFLCLSRKEQKEQFYSIWLLLWYGISRFFLDFLRAADLPNSDLRFWSLTLGQWGSLGLILIGLFLLRNLKRRHLIQNPKSFR